MGDSKALKPGLPTRSNKQMIYNKIYSSHIGMFDTDSCDGFYVTLLNHKIWMSAHCIAWFLYLIHFLTPQVVKDLFVSKLQGLFKSYVKTSQWG